MRTPDWTCPLFLSLRPSAMWQVLVSRVGDLLRDLASIIQRRAATPLEHPQTNGKPGYHALRRLLLTDGVSRTLFEEYASHRESARGEEETGWLLLGHREADQAVALATLP